MRDKGQMISMVRRLAPGLSHPNPKERARHEGIAKRELDRLSPAERVLFDQTAKELLAAKIARERGAMGGYTPRK